MLLNFVCENWASGALGPDSKLGDRDRVDVLMALMNNGVVSKRLLGETANLVMNGNITNVDVLC